MATSHESLQMLLWTLNGKETGRWNYGGEGVGLGSHVDISYSFLENSLPIYYTYDNEREEIIKGDEIYKLYIPNECRSFTSFQKTAIQGIAGSNESGILADISKIVDINFDENPGGELGQNHITFGNTAVANKNFTLKGWAFSPRIGENEENFFLQGGDVWINTNNWRMDINNASCWQAGSDGYSTLIHEIGHALGLTHPLNRDKDNPGEHLLDTNKSVMSYNDSGEIFPSTLMPYDIVALQHLYGARHNHTDSDEYSFAANSAVRMTIYDTGGNDTLDLSARSGNCVIDLSTAEGYAKEGNGNRFYVALAIAGEDAITQGCVIENATGGSGHDKIVGNAEDNHLTGGAGDDMLDGRGGNDTLEGGTGFDTYKVGNGRDTILDSDGLGNVFFGENPLIGGSIAGGSLVGQSLAKGVRDVNGHVTYRLVDGDLLVGSTTNANNTVLIKDFSNGDLGISFSDNKPLLNMLGRSSWIYGSGNEDTISSMDEDDFIVGAAGDDLLYAGADNDFAHGGLGNDRIYGQGGLDFLFGNEGNDKLFGGSGTDLIDGGEGDDLLCAGDSIWDIQLPAEAGQGDWLNGGAGNDELYGSARGDFLAGGAGRDKLYGGAGDDVLTGDGNYSASYAPYNIPVVSLNALQIQVELGILLSTLHGMPGMYIDALNTLAQLHTGETFFPTKPGLIGSDWTWHNPTSARPSGYWEKTAPTYQLIPKPEAYSWKTEINDDGSLTLVPKLARPSSQFTSAAPGGDADYLEGGEGHDWLYGGVGNDTLDGGAGADTYYFQIGDGVDHVLDRSLEFNPEEAIYYNTLRFGEGIQKGDLRVLDEGELLKIVYSTRDDTIILPKSDISEARFFNIRLADGTNFFLSDLLNVNHPPQSTSSIPEQHGKAGEDFHFVLPDDAFTDEDGHELVYTITLEDGSPLPAWLSFNAASRTLSGRPGPTDVGQLALKVTATDPSGTSATLAFSLGIERSLNIVTGTSGSDASLIGTDGDDQISGLGGSDIIHGGNGNDVLYGGNGSDTLYGDNGDDILLGEAGSDLLYGGNGADRIEGGDGSDTLYGDDGNDTLLGGAGSDLLYGGKGADRLEGGDGNDTLYGGYDNDFLLGDAGNDMLYGEAGDDVLDGGSGNDTLYGDDGSDTVLGGAGNDALYGGNGADRIEGGDGNDTAYGGADNDLLLGGAGNDRLYGESGNDVLDGGRGNDTLDGGAGDDLYLLHTGDGLDTISNIDSISFDILRFEDVASTGLQVGRSGNDLVIHYGESDAVTLKNHFLGKTYQIDRFEFSDGVELTVTGINALLESVA